MASGAANHIGIFKEFDPNGNIVAIECKSYTPALVIQSKNDKLLDKNQFYYGLNWGFI